MDEYPCVSPRGRYDMQCLPNIFEQDVLFPSKSQEGCSVGHTLRALDAGHVKVEVLRRMAAQLQPGIKAFSKAVRTESALKSGSQVHVWG